ncbi:MAG: amino acid adenylation domain-containing protein [Cyanobacteria bacterium P01_D01_bin.116]
MSNPYQRISALSPEKHQLLLQWLKQNKTDTFLKTQIICQSRESNSFPLSFAQQRLWFIDQLQPGNPAYNIHLPMRLIGRLNLVALEQTLNEIVKRHEILRTTFTKVEGQPVQIITPNLTLTLPVIDLRQLSKVEQITEVQRFSIKQSQRPFDLVQDPLLRCTLVQLGEQQYIMLLSTHHIVFDGWSLNLFTRELLVLYQAFSTGKPAFLPKLPIQYADFAVWQRQELQAEKLKSQLSYWKNQLANAPPLLPLPTERPRPRVQTYRGAVQSFLLPRSLTQSLKTIGKKAKATLFMTLLAAFQTLLYRYTGQEDIIVGSPIANRSRPEIEGLIGLFINTLVLRTTLSGNPTFEELLGRVQKVMMEAYANQDLPFEKLVEELQPERNANYNPLFQVALTLHNTLKVKAEVPGLTIKPFQVEDTKALLDLRLEITETDSGLEGFWEYNTDLFDADKINRMVEHYHCLLSSIIKNPKQHISELPILTQAEQHQLLLEWNNTQIEYPQNQCFHQLFEAQVEQTPDAVAVVFQDEQLTYRQLNQRANKLAHYLQQLGVKPEVLVGICVERSLEMVIGLLAILKAGGAYVPLDPAYPAERLAFALQDTQLRVLLTQQHLVENLPQDQTQVVCLDTDWESISQQSSQNLISECTTDNLAYIIYTSGSTGKPKGVLVNHSNVVRLLAATESWYNFNPNDVFSLFHSICFDFSVWEIWGALLYGGKLVVVPYMVSRSPEDFYKLLLTQQVTVLNQTPSAFRQLIQVEESLEKSHNLSLRKVIFGGEALQIESLRPWFERHGDQFPQLVNMYGITETTVHVTYRPLTKADLELASESLIGRPIPDLQVYLLDSYGQPVPIGIPGEMYIGGAGVVRGYLNRSTLTSQRFIPNRFSNKPNARLYKSGDLARYLPNGDIEYLGRIDHQVKVRGFRIELGEIEAVINQYPAVRETIVVVREDSVNSQRIIAYVVAQTEQTLAISELRSFLESKLPKYMVPGAFVTLEALPLTPNGKIDRKALPVPNTLRPELEQKYVAPQTNIEKQLVDIWAELLGLEKVGINDNFFELGGHSLLATQVISRINKTFDIELPLRRIFEFPTLAKLAKSIENEKVGSNQDRPIQRVSRNIELPLSFGQQRLWFINTLDPNSFAYNGFTALRMQGRLNTIALEDSVNEIIRRHEVLRTYFKAIEGQPIQKIAPVLKMSLAIVDLQNLPEIERKVEVQRLERADVQQPFNLTQAPLLRLTLVRLETIEHILLITMHHIIYDEWSVGIFIQELSSLYKAFSKGQPTPLGELPIQYADYAMWQQEWLKQEKVHTQIAYWKQQLEGAKTVLELPTDKPRSQLQTSLGTKHYFTLSKELSHSLKILSQQQGVTLFMTLLAAFNTLLYHYTKQKDILVGSPIANRNRSEIEGLIGFFVNTLVFRTNLSKNPSFKDLLQQVQEVALGAYTHQDLPFEKLVTELQIERNNNLSPLFQVWFVLQNAPASHLELEGLNLNIRDIESGMVRHDLNLNLSETSEDIEGFFEYKTDLFKANTIAQMAKLFETVLEIVVKQPDIHLKELVEMLSECQKQQQTLENQEFKKARLQKLGKISRKASKDISK